MMAIASGLRVLAVVVCLAPAVAVAQDASGAGTDDESGRAAASQPTVETEVDMGMGYQWGSSPVYGRYNGSPFAGFQSQMGFSVQSRNPDSGHYFSATGNGIGVSGNGREVSPDAEGAMGLGQPGRWGLGASYEGLYNINGNAR